MTFEAMCTGSVAVTRRAAVTALAAGLSSGGEAWSADTPDHPQFATGAGRVALRHSGDALFLAAAMMWAVASLAFQRSGLKPRHRAGGCHLVE